MRNKYYALRMIGYSFLLLFLFQSKNAKASNSCASPDNLHVTTLTMNSGQLEWDPSSDANTGYVLRFKPVNSNVWVRQTSGNTTETITGLVPNTLYEAKVRSDCDDEAGEYCSVITFTTPSSLSCGIPNVYFFGTDEITPNTARVDWRNVSGATSYIVHYRVRFSNDQWMSVPTSSTLSEAHLTGLIPATQYEFQVQTICPTGSGVFSLSGIFSTEEGTCNPPSGLSANNVTTSTANIAWNSVSCASIYVIQYRPLHAGWMTDSAHSSSTTLSNLTPGTNYEFQVISVDTTGGNSSISNPYTFTTSSPGCGITDLITTPNVGTNDATIDWNAVPSATSYNVRYHLAGSPTWQIESTAGNTTTLTGLSPDNVYEFQIQSICSAGPSSFSPMASFLTLPYAGTSHVPVPDHIVICMLENKAFTQIAGSSHAPNFNALMTDPYSAVFEESYGITHPSQPNYIHFFSGGSQGVTDNTIPASHFNTPNLARELLNAGRTYKTYAEGLPSVGYDGTSSGRYVKRHNPVTDWVGSGVNQVSSTLNQPFSSFPAGNYSALPTVSMVIPNLDNDMHDGALGTALATGDAWFHDNMLPYIQWAKTHNSLFILTTDEDDGSHSNRVLTIFNGQMVNGGTYSVAINHYTVLRTIAEMYGLNFIGHAGGESAISGCWTNGFRMAQQAAETDSVAAVVTPPVAAQELKIEKPITGWKLFPNPAFGEINFNFELAQDDAVSYTIFNNAGSLMAEEKLGSVKKGTHTQRILLDSRKYSQGVYLIEVKYGDKYFSQRFLISK